MIVPTTAVDPGAQPAGLVAGVRVRVRVPATSANLGPGFDAFGLALARYDEIEVETGTGTGGLEVLVEGEGAEQGSLPRDETHLVLRALRAGLAAAGAAPDALERAAGLRLTCRNQIPHGRGMGSSAAAVVAGLLAARGLLADQSRLDDAAVLDLATGFEGHPDNAAAALHGGFTISWMIGPEDDAEVRPGTAARAVRLEVHPAVTALVCLPAGELATVRARTMLPAEVAHADAAFNAGRSGLLVEALTRRPDLLLDATQDRLHQSQRAPAMPGTAALVHRIRVAGGAAVISGAGPSVLVLGPSSVVEASVRTAMASLRRASSWQLLPLSISTIGAQVTTEGVREQR